MSIPREDREETPVRKWRRRYFLSQAQLGKLLGVSSTTVRNRERGDTVTPEWVLDIVGHKADAYTLRKINEIEPQPNYNGV